MTDPFVVEWSADAHDDWLRLPLAEARAIATAVQRFADTGQGIVIAGDGGTYLLFVGDVTVVLLIDGGTLHVWRIRHT